MKTLSTMELMQNARRAGTAVPAFNIPYLPMMKPVVTALQEADTFGLIAVARLEWLKFEATAADPPSSRNTARSRDTSKECNSGASQRWQSIACSSANFPAALFRSTRFAPI